MQRRNCRGTHGTHVSYGGPFRARIGSLESGGGRAGRKRTGCWIGAQAGMRERRGEERRRGTMAGVSAEFDLEAFRNLDVSVISRPR